MPQRHVASACCASGRVVVTSAFARALHRLDDAACISACSVAASYKPPMLVTRVRLPACAHFPTQAAFVLLRRSILTRSGWRA